MQMQSKIVYTSKLESWDTAGVGYNDTRSTRRWNIDMIIYMKKKLHPYLPIKSSLNINLKRYNSFT